MRRFNPSMVVLALVVLIGMVTSAHGQSRARLRWLRDKPKIDRLVFSGNKHFSDGELGKRMYSRTYTTWSAIKGDRRARVQRESLARDTLEIKYLYLSSGFLNINVSESFELIQPDSTALVVVRVLEGDRQFYGEVTLTGNYPPKLDYEMKKVTARLKRGEPINLFDLRGVSFDIKTILANSGYPYATVDYSLGVSGTAVTPITYSVNSDSLVHFGELTIKGTYNYPDYTARRESKLQKGAVYRRKDILESQQRLFESGYFSSLRLFQSEESLDRLEPDFTLQVRERKPKFVTFRTGAGQSQYKDLIWDISGTFGKRNFLGSRRLELISDYSFSLGDNVRLITHRYRVRFTEPWSLGIRMPLQLTGQYEPRLKDPVQDYKVESWSVSAATAKNFGHFIRTELGFEFESVNIIGVTQELSRQIRDADGISVRRNLYFTFRRDSRDNVFIPRRGVYAEIETEYYGGFLGGDDNFTRVKASFARYEKVWPGWIMASRIMGGSVEQFGNSTEVPINDRLYLGGANTVRGFRENSLGPKGSENAPIGAKLTFVFNQEFRWRTIQIFNVVPLLKDFFSTLPLWQSAFVDVGNGFAERTNFKLRDLAVSYGTGVQIVSPAGPIRLDYARVVPTESFDVADRWHFTILYAF